MYASETLIFIVIGVFIGNEFKELADNTDGPAVGRLRLLAGTSGTGGASGADTGARVQWAGMDFL